MSDAAVPDLPLPRVPDRRDLEAAVLFLATADGYKIARTLSPDTLRAVYADIVTPKEVADGGK